MNPNTPILLQDLILEFFFNFNSDFSFNLSIQLRSFTMSSKKGPPKHQNKYAWKPNLGVKINETEPGGRFRPLSEITGVCHRCKDQIDWKRKYGKYKALIEPAKCQKCSKRNVRQAYHSICNACAKEHKVCAKCLCRVDQIVGRDITEKEAEKKALELAIKNARERDRRTILRAMSKEESSAKIKTGDLLQGLSLENAQSESDIDDEENDSDVDDDENESDVDGDDDTRENNDDNDDLDADLPKGDEGVYEKDNSEDEDSTNKEDLQKSHS